MAFTKINVHKELNLPSLVDLCFLLIIYSLITLPVTKSRVESGRRGKQQSESDLPQTRQNALENADLVLTTLMFKVETGDSADKKDRRILYVLVPGESDTLTLASAKAAALRDSLVAEFPMGYAQMPEPDFLRLRGCRLIREQIATYKNNHFIKPSHSNIIKIRAVRETEFRLVNYIMDQCALYGDTIPRIEVHTSSTAGGPGGL
jgi:hypothetical protein